MDHLCRNKGETLEETFEVFDKVAEADIDYMRKVLRLYDVPEEVIENVVVKQIRCTFQAQILFLRERLKTEIGFNLYWSAPEELVRNVELMATVERELAKEDRERAQALMENLRRRHPAKPKLRLVTR